MIEEEKFSLEDLIPGESEDVGSAMLRCYNLKDKYKQHASTIKKDNSVFEKQMLIDKGLSILDQIEENVLTEKKLPLLKQIIKKYISTFEDVYGIFVTTELPLFIQPKNDTMDDTIEKETPIGIDTHYKTNSGLYDTIDKYDTIESLGKFFNWFLNELQHKI